MQSANHHLPEFEKIFSQTRDRLFGFLKGILRDETKVQDCMQQCYLNLWESIDRIDKEKDVLPLLYTYARNVAIDHIRSNAKYVWVEDISLYSSAIENNTEKQYADKEIAKLVLGILPPRKREVFRLIKLQGLSYKEAATQLNISIHTVENHMQEAKKLLTEEMPGYLTVVYIISNGLQLLQA